MKSDLRSKRKRIKINISKYCWKLKCTSEAFMMPDSFLFPWRENTLLVFQCQRDVDFTTTTETWRRCILNLADLTIPSETAEAQLVLCLWGIFRQHHTEEMGASLNVGRSIQRGKKKKASWARILSEASHLLRSDEYFCHVFLPSPLSPQTSRAKQPQSEPPETKSQKNCFLPSVVS